MKVLDNIPVSLDSMDVLKNIRMRNISMSVQKSVQELLDSVLPAARPKALYKVAYV